MTSTNNPEPGAQPEPYPWETTPPKKARKGMSRKAKLAIGGLTIFAVGGVAAAVSGTGEEIDQKAAEITASASASGSSEEAPEPAADSPSVSPGDFPGAETTEDALFLKTLQEFGLTSNNDPASMNTMFIVLGEAVCLAYSTGASDDDVALTLLDTGWQPEEAGWIVGAAKAAYCPQYG